MTFHTTILLKRVRVSFEDMPFQQRPNLYKNKPSYQLISMIVINSFQWRLSWTGILFTFLTWQIILLVDICLLVEDNVLISYYFLVVSLSFHTTALHNRVRLHTTILLNRVQVAFEDILAFSAKTQSLQKQIQLSAHFSEEYSE